MKPKDLLFARVEAGVIYISPTNINHLLSLIGTTISTPVPAGTSGMSSMAFQPGENFQQGLIALEVKSSTEKKDGHTLLIEVKNDNGKLNVNLAEEWIPGANKKLSGFLEFDVHAGGSAVVVKIDEDYFWSKTDNNFRKEMYGRLLPGQGNLLVRYLYGEVEAEAIIAATGEFQAEKSAQEQLATVKGLLAETARKSGDTAEELTKLRTSSEATIDRLKAEIAARKNLEFSWESTANRLMDCLLYQEELPPAGYRVCSEPGFWAYFKAALRAIWNWKKQMRLETEGRKAYEMTKKKSETVQNIYDPSYEE